MRPRIKVCPHRSYFSNGDNRDFKYQSPDVQRGLLFFHFIVLLPDFDVEDPSTEPLYFLKLQGTR